MGIDEQDDKITKLIEDAYDNTNFGSLEKVFTYLQKHNHKDVTRSEIKKFLDSQVEVQLLKQTKAPRNGGHLTALYPNEIWQLDIFIFNKFKYNNKNNQYILAAVDIFTRYAYAVPMKSKDSSDVVNALKIMFKQAREKPILIMSDNDASFLSDECQNFLQKENIILEPNVLGDHNALGIIDNFARRIKGILGKFMLKNKTNDWINELQKRIMVYNKSPHMGLDGLSPIEAEEESNLNFVLNLNLVKRVKNKTVSDLKPGDKVRINIAGKFTKSSEPQFSDKVYKVVSVRANNITLDNNETKKRNKLLLVPPDTKSSIEPNLIKVATKAHKVEKVLKKEDIQQNHIIREPRIRKAREILDL